MSALLLAGVVGAARGLKGEVFVQVRTDRPEEVFAPGQNLTVEKPSKGAPESAFAEGFLASLGGTLTVASSRVQGARITCRFKGVQDRNQAEALRGCRLLTEESSEEDAWYPHELVGLRAVDPDGSLIGTVTGLHEGAAHDQLLVQVGDKEVMVPFVREIVPKVSLEDGEVIIDAPQGLFDLP